MRIYNVGAKWNCAGSYSHQTKIESAIEKCFLPASEGGVKNSMPKGNKKIFWELFEEKKALYIERFFKQEGFRIEKGAVDILLELVENNTDSLRSECSKIALFFRREEGGEWTAL